MASFAFFSSVHPNQTLASNEHGYLGRNATINGSVGSSSIVTAVDVVIDGTVYANGLTPVRLAGDRITVDVGSEGLIRGTSADSFSISAVRLQATGSISAAAARLSNAGQIRGNVSGVWADAEEANDIVRIINSGLIQGERDGIQIYGVGTVHITNTGTIGGFRGGVCQDVSHETATQLFLTNLGVIQGATVGVQVGGAADVVINRGQILGEIQMGEGDDMFDGRGGTVEGTILLHAGDDSFIGNANWGETVDGGDGKDTLDLRLGAGAVVSLDDPGDHGGAAQGDVYLAFEVIFGSRSGADQLRGNAASNVFWGLGGNDVLDGAGGNDFLIGGKGADVLSGGTGNDSFQYMLLNEIGDTISGFSSAGVGNNDAFKISASAFGGGLAPGALAAIQFQSRADNVAQDADDRFIFRTTDKTLWFDADGNGAAAAVMVADLQASATMTNADIILI